MIVSDHLVFIHLHKSGGTFINQLLLQCVPSARQLGYHLPYRELPDEYRSLAVVGSVRNPWDYYVSWYHFQNGQAKPNALFRICSEDRKHGFSETVRNLAQLGSNSARLETLRGRLPHHFRGAGLNLTKSCLDDLKGRDTGFYSFLYERMYRGAANLKVVAMEDLRRGIRLVLADLGVMPNTQADLFLQQAPRMNVTRHDHYRHFYNTELRDLIAKLESPIIAQHEYRF